MFYRSNLLVILPFILSLDTLAEDHRHLMRQPDIHGELVIFVYGDDLWSVSAKPSTT